MLCAQDEYTMTITKNSQHRLLLKKSRSGCADCRMRKVKCDEIKPVCSNCRRRYVDIECCDWGTLVAVPRVKPHSQSKAVDTETRRGSITNSELTCIAPTISSSLITGSKRLSSTNQYCILDLKLVYHYTTVVSSTMPFCDGIPKSAWQETIPKLAFESETVLFPMLAISALHYLVHSPGDSEMGFALRQFLGKSLTRHRAALSDPHHDLSEELWLSVSILSHIYWLLVHQARPDESYELPLQAFKVMEGLSLISGSHFDQLAAMNYHWVQHKDMISIKPTSSLSLESQAQLRSIEEELTLLLHSFGSSSLQVPEKDIYLEAKHYILYHYQAFYSGAKAQHLQRFVTYMPLILHPRYRVMLTEHDPLAMGLLARMLVLLCGLDYAWWVNGGADYEVVERDVRGIYGLLPEDLRWIMDWPLSVVNKIVVVRRD